MYDLYVWETGTSQTGALRKNNITFINTSYSGILQYEKNYNWQVHAKNSCSSTPGPIQTFQMRYLPDLEITNILAPQNLYAGQPLTLSWTVHNAGLGETYSQQWYDACYLSLDSIFDGSDVFLGQVGNLAALDTTESYVMTADFTIPSEIFGDFFVIMVADKGNSLAESDETNNYLVDTALHLEVQIPPRPDLVTTSVGAPTSFYSNNTITVTYNVLNEGFANAQGDVGRTFNMGSCALHERYWNDQIYISPDTFFSLSDAHHIGSVTVGLRSHALGTPSSCDPNWYNFPDYLAIDSSYTMTADVVIPHNIYGTYYIYVLADRRYPNSSHDLVDEMVETNNWNRTGALDVNLTPPPNLEVNYVEAPSLALSGEQIKIKWEVENTGANAPMETQWIDRVYISQVDSFNLNMASLISTRYHYGGNNFNPFDTYTDSILYNLPNGVTGQYYLYVHTDASNQVFEYVFDNDNHKRSLPLTVSLAPYPDLTITNITMGTVTGPGDVVPISWTVKNEGNTSCTGVWADRVYLSSHPNWVPSGTQTLLTQTVATPLPVGDSYTRNGNFTVPQTSTGLYYVYVYTDYSDAVYEYHYEGNNVANAGYFEDTTQVEIPPIVIVADTLDSDLDLLSVNIPTTMWTGHTYSFTWQVENIGEEATDNNKWKDMFWLSSDMQLSSDDELIKTKYHNGILSVGNTYTVTETFTLDHDLVGTYYLISRIDHYDWETNELDEQNNKSVQAVEIFFSPPPDLVVDEFVVPTAAISGQYLTLNYEVLNQGSGPTIVSPFYDRVYLSTSPNLTGWKYNLETVTRYAPLAANDSYSGSLGVTIPSWASGFYYVIYATDQSERVFENGMDNNNLAYQTISITQPAPSDLKISALSIPDSITLGDDVSINYTIENIGQNPAVGSLRDAFYFSEDTLFDGAIDKILGINERGVYIQPGQTITSTVSGKTPNVLPGDYFGVGRTNLLKTILESDDTNNDTITQNTMNVDIEELILDVQKTDVPLDDGDMLYYKVDVAADLDLLITLTSNLAHGSNEIYVAYDRVPAVNDFDFNYEYPQSTNQIVLVPTTQAGSYYVLIKTPTDFYGLQEVDVLAQALPFSMVTIDPDTVGAGEVTNEIIGAGFKSLTQFWLYNGATPVVQGSIHNYINSMNVQVYWNLEEVPYGTYDVVAINPDTSITMSNGITVEESSGFVVDFNYVSPNLIRADRKAIYTFYFKNMGNVDIPYVKAGIAIPVYSEIEALKVSDGIMLRSDVFGILDMDIDDYLDEGSARVIPLIRKDLKPGELMTVNLVVSGFQQAVYNVNLYAFGYSTADYIWNQLHGAENIRRTMLSNPELFIYAQSPEYQTIVNDCEAFRDSIYHAMVMMGLVTTADSVGVDISCDTISAGLIDGFGPATYLSEHTYSPGTSPGVYNTPVASFESGDDYLWEINKYGGYSGGDPGWDLIHCSNSIQVNATSENPFVIRVASLNYWNQPDYLAGWYPAVDKCWPIAVADGGFVGFDTSKFALDLTRFTDYNYTYGGTWSLQLQGTDTLLLCFNAYVPQVGEDGVPGAPGAPGENGSPGGQGGPGDPALGILPGIGGVGGQGGPGMPALDILPGDGGQGGQGGQGGDGQNGGQGGQGGLGGNGGFGQPGGQGGQGGQGGNGGLNGNGGDGGIGGIGGLSGPTLPPIVIPPGALGGPGGIGGIAGPTIGGAIITHPGSVGTTGSTGGTTPSNGSTNNATPGNVNTNSNGGVPNPNSNNNLNNNSTSSPSPTTGPSVMGVPCSSDDFEQKVCDKILPLTSCVWGSIGCLGFLAVVTGVSGGTLGWFTTTVGVAGCVAAIATCIKYATGYDPGVPKGVSLVGCLGDITSVSICVLEEFCNAVVKSCDPNDIVGPPGFGDGKFVAQNDILPYTIRFENDSTFATAAAQRVEITQQIPATLNPLSLRLSDFGFGEHIFSVPENSASYFEVLDMPDSLGWDLEVTAGVDIVDNEVFWVFQTIDPSTGLPPNDALMGFLAINDTLGAGEGFVGYTIIPSAATQTGDTIFAEASIVFDTNEPILTPQIFNTIDAYGPTSIVAQLPEISDTTTISIDIIGADDPGGSGVKSYNLYYSEAGGPWILFKSFDFGDAITFTGLDNTHYGFFSQATDNVGYEEPMKNYAEASTIINPATLSLGGMLTYENTMESPISGAMIIAKDTLGLPVDTVFTDAIGNYYFATLPPDVYNLETVVTLPWGGGNATDALIINKFTISAYNLSAFRELAADVNASTTVNATDGLLIKRRTISSISAFAAGDWIAEQPTVVLDHNSVMDIKALCFGDVNGSYALSSPFAKSSSGNVEMNSFGQVSAVSGAEFVVDISIEDELEAGAITLHIEYDESMMQLIDLSLEIPDMLYKDHNGVVSIAWESLQSLYLYEGSRLMSLKFRANATDVSTLSSLSAVFDSEVANRNAVVYPKVLLSYPEITILKKGEYALGHAYPNPFSDFTEITYSMPESGEVKLNVFNALGQPIHTLVDQSQMAGNHKVRFEAGDLPAGVYQYKISIDGDSQVFNKTNMMIINR